MIYVIAASLSECENARKIECTDGIINKKGISECNISFNDVPYFHLHFVEVIDGIRRRTGYRKMWGKFKDNKIVWSGFDLRAYRQILEDGPCTIDFVFALLYIIDVAFFDEFIGHPNNYLFEFLIKFYPDFNLDELYGKLITKNVEPYFDEQNNLQTTYTCFLFEEELTDDRIRREFKYQGRKVVISTGIDA